MCRIRNNIKSHKNMVANTIKKSAKCWMNEVLVILCKIYYNITIIFVGTANYNKCTDFIIFYIY